MKFALSLVASLALAGTAWAGGVASGSKISEKITGNTVQGSMEASGAYTEFYAADGVIKGMDYTGKWHVADDTMCFAYGTDPADCWNVRFDGDEVAWIKDGVVQGTGTLVEGNPNSF